MYRVVQTHTKSPAGVRRLGFFYHICRTAPPRVYLRDGIPKELDHSGKSGYDLLGGPRLEPLLPGAQRCSEMTGAIMYSVPSGALGTSSRAVL